LLYRLWLGGGGVKGAGGVQGGCAQLAEPVPGSPDVFLAVGLCGGKLRSLGIAGTDFAALLYQQAARWALGRARAGDVLAAYGRREIAAGDLYVVVTRGGVYILSRSQSGAGQPASDTAPRRCQDIADSNGLNVPYVVVPPALIVPWLSVVERIGWVWPVRDLAARSRAYAFEKTEKHQMVVVAHATCASDRQCTLIDPTGRHVSTDDGRLAVDTLLGLAPAPS
jgi:hypothetical protein